MQSSRRRTTLGLNASAALPKLWEILEDRGWTDSDFARAATTALGKIMTTGGAAKLLYGDVEAHRTIAVWCWEEFELDLHLWDQTCPAKRRPHARTRPAHARARRNDLAATG